LDELDERETDSGETIASAAMRAADALREHILVGKVPAGSVLRETALCELLDVSRNTVREALRQLVSEGLLDQQLYKGTTVRTMSCEDVRDIFAVRRALQFRAIEESALAPQERFDALQRFVDDADQAVRAGDWLSAGTANLRFHHGIVALLGSQRLDTFFAVVMTQLSLALADARSDQGFQSHWIKGNRSICEHLCSGQRKEAALALTQFLDESERVVLDIVRFTWRRLNAGAAAGKPFASFS